VTLVEKDVCHVVVAAIDDQSSDPPDSPIGGVHVLASADLHLSCGYSVIGGCLPYATAEPEVGQRQHLPLPVTPLAGRAGQKLCLFSALKRLELSHAAPQPEVLRRRVDKIDVHEAAGVSPVPWFDDEMRQRLGNGINDHSSQMPANAVVAHDFAANGENRGSVHQEPASR
jgi:hypothetical protein